MSHAGNGLAHMKESPVTLQRRRKLPDRPEKAYHCRGTSTTSPCKKAFTTSRALLRHLREASAHRSANVEEEYRCDYCRTPFARKESRLRHEKEMHLGVGRTRPAQEAVPVDLDIRMLPADPAPPVEWTSAEYLDFAYNYQAAFDLSAQSANTLPNGELRQIQNVSPRIGCPICLVPFLDGDHQALYKHLDQHFVQLESKHVCKICNIGFLRPDELQRHQSCAAIGQCGFEFVHLARCTGHHPPLGKYYHRPSLLNDNDRFAFCFRPHQWAKAQLDAHESAVQVMEGEHETYGASSANKSIALTSLSKTLRGSHVYDEATIRACLTASHLHKSVCSGNIDLTVSLLLCSEDPNELDDNGLTPLHIAVCLGLQDVCRILLRHGSSPDATACPKLKINSLREGDTSLHVACRFERESVARLLLEGGAGINRVNKDGVTALDISLVDYNPAFVQLLLQSEADVKQRHFKIMLEDHNLPKFTNLVNGLTNLAGNFISEALRQACMLGSDAAVKVCVENGARPDASCLWTLTSKGKHDIASYLLSLGILTEKSLFESYEHASLALAARYGDLKMVNLFLSKGAIPNFISQAPTASEETTPLINAVEQWLYAPSEANENIIQSLVENGASINLTVGRGREISSSDRLNYISPMKLAKEANRQDLVAKMKSWYDQYLSVWACMRQFD